MQQKSSSKVNLAYDDLKAKIISFKYAPGVPLSDYKISQDLNISRSSVREAILLLEMDGLVVVNSSRKVVVAPIGLDDILDILRVRLAIECAAVKIIAESGWFDKKTERQLKSINAKFKSSAKKNDHVAQYEYDDMFHQQIVEYSKSPRALKTFNNMRVQMQRARWLNIMDYSRQTQVAVEHTNLLNAMLDHDLDETLRCYDVHLTNSCEAYRSALHDEQIQKLALMISSFYP